jgi:hypothetical protein
MAAGRTPHTIAQKRAEVIKTFMSNIAHNRVLGIFVAGIGCGVLAFCYSTILELFLDLTWNIIPENLVRPALEKVGWPDKNTWVGGLWVLAIPTLYGLIVGAVQGVLGAPGDMPETVGSFNQDGYVDYSKVRMNQALFMQYSACQRKLHTVTWVLHTQSKRSRAK